MSITERFRALFNPTSYNIIVTPESYPTVDGMTARKLYATQANLHAVVSFLSDSIAQLPLKVYTRNGETDRERDRDSVAAKLLWQPNSDQTAYELINGLTTELFLMGVGVLWLLPSDHPARMDHGPEEHNELCSGCSEDLHGQQHEDHRDPSQRVRYVPDV